MTYKLASFHIFWLYLFLLSAYCHSEINDSHVNALTLFDKDLSKQKCESIRIPLCAHLPYKTTRLPNLFGARNQHTVAIDSLRFSKLLQDDSCRPGLKAFLCSAYVPPCTKPQAGASLLPVPPCREVCAKVQTACGSAISASAFQWPAELTCTSFPTESSRAKCLREGEFGTEGDEDGPGSINSENENTVSVSRQNGRNQIPDRNKLVANGDSGSSSSNSVNFQPDEKSGHSEHNADQLHHQNQGGVSGTSNDNRGQSEPNTEMSESRRRKNKELENLLLASSRNRQRNRHRNQNGTTGQTSIGSAVHENPTVQKTKGNVRFGVISVHAEDHVVGIDNIRAEVIDEHSNVASSTRSRQQNDGPIARPSHTGRSSSFRQKVPRLRHWRHMPHKRHLKFRKGRQIEPKASAVNRTKLIDRGQVMIMASGATDRAGGLTRQGSSKGKNAKGGPNYTEGSSKWVVNVHFGDDRERSHLIQGNSPKIGRLRNMHARLFRDQRITAKQRQLRERQMPPTAASHRNAELEYRRRLQVQRQQAQQRLLKQKQMQQQQQQQRQQDTRSSGNRNLAPKRTSDNPTNKGLENVKKVVEKIKQWMRTGQKLLSQFEYSARWARRI